MNIFFDVPRFYTYQPPMVCQPVELIVKQVAKENEFTEVDRLLKLFWCESRYNSQAQGFNKDSVDRGIAQINSKWHPEVSDDCAYDIKCATKESIRIIRKSGWQQWVCGRKKTTPN